MPTTPQEPLDVQRVLMDRARRHAAQDSQRQPRPALPRLVSLALALLVVAVVLFAFDRFLASVQRFLALPITEPMPAASDPVPAYVVPVEPEAAPESEPSPPQPPQ